jgi:2-C-methyl-D-erythritol 4-phosphate cytidylyltransferase
LKRVSIFRMTSAIIVAAGSSSRMGFNKLLADLCGLPVIVRAVEAFETCEDIDEIIVVASDEVREVLAKHTLPKLKRVVSGGTERHLSVWEGLRAVSPQSDIVAVHDGGRPLISPDQISKCIAVARNKRAVACARPVTETLKRCDDSAKITNSIERKNAWIMETPQVFDHELLTTAYEHVLGNALTVTDEVSAVQALGESVYVVENATPNPKITYPQDLELAASLLA